MPSYGTFGRVLAALGLANVWGYPINSARPTQSAQNGGEDSEALEVFICGTELSLGPGASDQDIIEAT
jgi:hypothetical protein